MSAEDLPAGHPPGVPHRHDRPTRPGAGRRAQGRPAEHDGVVLAERGRGGRLAARLPPERQGPPADDQGGGPADPGRRAAGALRRRRHPQGPGRRGAAGAGRADRHPRRHHADGPGRLPRRPSAVPRHARHARQRHGGHRAAEGRPADRPRRPLRRPGHRQGVGVRARRQGHPRRHRSGRAGQGPPARRAHRRRLPAGHRGARQGHPRRARRGGAEQADTSAWRSRISGWREQFPYTYEQSRAGRGAEAAVLPRDAARRRARGHDPRVAASASTRCGRRQYWRFNEPYTWVNSGGLGTMGFSVPAAIGAKVGRPDRTVWADRRRRLLPDDGAGAGDGHRPSASRSRSPSSTTATSAWCASGRRCSTTSATARCTSRPTCPTT